MQTTAPARAIPSREAVLMLHLGMVSATDGILFTAVERSADALRNRIAVFVRQRAETTLWPDDAAELKGLLAAGRSEDAIAFYFSRVGERWDREFLHREPIGVTYRDEVRQP